MNKRVLILLVILILTLFVLYIFKSYKGDIFTFVAYHYFKRNDMAKAQIYYEQAFNLGVQSSKHRDFYVNSILNSPLTTDSQEKLVKLLNYPIEDEPKNKVSRFLDDYKKEIHSLYSQNYINHTPFNQKVVRWNELPITYGFVNSTVAPEYFVKEIENAFLEWEIESEHKLYFLRNDINPNIVIKFMSNNPADLQDKKYVVAYTVPTINDTKLLSMHINFYLKDPYNDFYTKNQIYNTALHEIAHAIGFMGHSNDKMNIMYLTRDSVTTDKDVRLSLNSADVNTIKLLYDIKPDITNSTLLASKYIPYLVLGDNREISKTKMEEARNYVQKAPGLPSGYIDLAESYAQNKNYAKAIRILERALRLSDTDEIRDIIYYNLALCYYMINHIELAESYLDKSLETSNSIEKQRLLAEISLKSSKKERAIEIYKNLISNDLKNIEYVIALTNIYVENKDYKNARATLKSFIKYNPSEKNNPRLKSYGVLMRFL